MEEGAGTEEAGEEVGVIFSDTIRTALSAKRLKRFRKTCLECGFLGWDNSEVVLEHRIRLGCRGSIGWYKDTSGIDCAKGLWVSLGDHDSHSIVMNETELARSVLGFRVCPGFRFYVPGRSPAEHFKLEDESRLFRNQRLIAVLAFLGALLGALIGALWGKL